MIQAQELRLGNWVKNAYGSHIKKEFVGKYCRLDQRELGELLINDFSSFYDPIPLTSEILEKAGFKWNGDNGKTKRYFLGGLRITMPFCDLSILRHCDKAGESQAGLCGKSIGDHIHIQSLHQLQNLYFALTGQELTINL